MTTKKTKGKQKIEIKKIEDFVDRKIKFSKRSAGIYKKVSELNILCGANIGLLMFSPSDEPISYGDPSFKEVARCFLTQHSSNLVAHPQIEPFMKQRIDALNMRYNKLIEDVNAVAGDHKIKSLKKDKEPYVNGWWNKPIKNLSPQEGLKTLQSFQDLYNKLYKLFIERTGRPPIDLNFPPLDPS